MGNKSAKAPETPDLAAATREGYLADIETMPMRLAADGAYKAGGALYKTADGRYFSTDPSADAKKADELLAALPESWRGALQSQIKEKGLQQAVADNRAWTNAARAGEHSAEGLGEADFAAFEAWANAATGGVPSGATMVADFTGQGEQASLDRNAAIQKQMLQAGADISLDLERKRLANELELLPQYNALNLDQQKAAYAAALEAQQTGTANAYDQQLAYGSKFNDLALQNQQAAWEQSLANGIAGTRQMTDLQAQLLPQINDLYRAEQQKSAGQYLLNQHQAWNLTDTLAAQQASRGAEYGLALAKNQQKTQSDAFRQNLDNAARATDAQTAQAAGLQAQLLPWMQALQQAGQADANAGSRADSRAAVTDMASLLPQLNTQQMGMQSQANAASNADAYQAALKAATMQQEFNQLQRGDQAADFSQNLGQNLQSVQALAALQPGMNAQTQALTMGNQAQANAASLQDSLRAAGITADMAANLMPQFAAMSQAAQRDAAGKAYDLQAQYLPGLNQTNLAAQTQARDAALESLKRTNPTGYAAKEALGAQVNADLALGDQLSAAQQRRVEQNMRAAQAARGNILGDAPMVDEIMAVTGYGDQLKQQRQGAALNYINSADLMPQFEATQGQNFAAGLNLGNAIESGAQAALGQFRPQTGYQGAAVADPLAAFNVNANTAQSSGYDAALGRYAPQTGYQALDAGLAAQQYQAQTGRQAIQVQNPLTQTSVNANTATGYEFSNPFNNLNPQVQTAPVQTQQAMNPLMPNFSGQTGQVSSAMPNFQATQTSGPSLAPVSINTGMSGMWNTGAGSQGSSWAQQNYQNQWNQYQQQQQEKMNTVNGLFSLAGTAAGAFI